MQVEACSLPLAVSGLLCRMRCRRAHDFWTSCFLWGDLEFAPIIFEQNMICSRMGLFHFGKHRERGYFCNVSLSYMMYPHHLFRFQKVRQVTHLMPIILYFLLVFVSELACVYFN